MTAKDIIFDEGARAQIESIDFVGNEAMRSSVLHKVINKQSSVFIH